MEILLQHLKALQEDRMGCPRWRLGHGLGKASWRRSYVHSLEEVSDEGKGQPVQLG